MEPVPFLDLARDPLGLAPAMEAALVEVWQSRQFVGGPRHTALCDALEARLGRPVALVSSGTAALELALEVLGLERGEVVLAPALTFAATASAVVRAGGVPRAMDVCADTGLMDERAVAAFLAECPVKNGTVVDPDTGGRIRGLLPVSLYGRPLAREPWQRIAGAYRLFLLEDAAQAMGAGTGAEAAGTWADMAAFSTYPTKNFAGPGEGGFVAGSQEAVERLARLANQGQTDKYEHAVVGTNARLPALVAAVLEVALPRLDELNALRQSIAACYRDALGGTLTIPPDQDGHIYHQFVVRHKERGRFAAALAEKGVATAVHYQMPWPSQPAFSSCPAAPLPEAARWCAEVLSLPCFPGMTEAEVERVIAAVAEAA
ncbi:aminotransferase class I/II-fold pyridoxal phosphate-dependent enzyme [bacterium]|nr:aminotransferase class I/II-fold pyridoxal phosphate-dependent enzyme [bacterium]